MPKRRNSDEFHTPEREFEQPAAEFTSPGEEFKKPGASTAQTAPKSRSKRGLYAGIAAVFVIGAVVYFGSWRTPSAPAPTADPTTAPTETVRPQETAPAETDAVTGSGEWVLQYTERDIGDGLVRTEDPGGMTCRLTEEPDGALHAEFFSGGVRSGELTYAPEGDGYAAETEETEFSVKTRTLRFAGDALIVETVTSGSAASGDYRYVTREVYQQK